MPNNRYNLRQLELVEFSEQVYHSKLRHKGINGSLYEDILIKYLREDIPELNFFKGQIIDNEETSAQYDIIICKKGTLQAPFLSKVTPYVSIVKRNDCLGVIELKKWGNPKMIGESGVISSAYKKFKDCFPELKYFFLCFRFKDRKYKIKNNWAILEQKLLTDGNFCFFGRSDVKDKEWEFPWLIDRFDKHENYLGEYEELIEEIRSII